MLTAEELPCIHRGKNRNSGLFDCSQHGQCSIEKIHDRIRPCILCSDRQEGGPDALMLGDVVERGLKILGITKDRVSKWLGEPCNCDERREKLNQLHAWAVRVVKGKVEKAGEYLDQILGG